MTLEELQACETPRFYEVLESWQFIPSIEEYPYREFIENLYLKRLELKQKNDPLQLPIKIILNSIYGKTGQRTNRKIGNLFNPILFSFITGFARAQLYRFVIKYDIERSAVAFATDSICTTKKLDIDSSRLGKFSFEDSADDVFYLQNGFYRFNDIWKQRGFGRLGSKDIEHLETFVEKGKLLYKIKVLRNTRLRSSILQNRITDIGKIRPVIKKINLNADRKRLWLQRLEAIDYTINESVPLSMNNIKKEEI